MMRKVLVLLSLVVAAPELAHAVVYLDCIAHAKGQKVRWNQFWDNDKRDNDVVYKINFVSEIDKIPLREITLDLHADGGAARTVRRLVVSTEEKARAVCERLVQEQRVLHFPESGQSDDPSQLPFIQVSRDGWVRGDPEPGVQLTICKVGEQRFSCSESDRAKFGALLKTLEEDLRAQGH